MAFRFCGPQTTPDEARMQRLRLKADGRIVELRDGQEFPLAPVMAGVPRPSPPLFPLRPTRPHHPRCAISAAAPA